ncbi:hypothetical protein ACFXGG_08605 [Streptomyces nigra]|uniref:MmyB family transcriptional regulator n=1 Tax=Streptomyces nigra TaxID=1827580 RepID=UPI0036A4C6EB
MGHARRTSAPTWTGRPGRAGRPTAGENRRSCGPRSRHSSTSAGGQAAIVVGRRADVLGGSRLGFALWGLPTPDPASDEPRPNTARITFLDMPARDLFPS